jgi:hypothetical protein
MSASTHSKSGEIGGELSSIAASITSRAALASPPSINSSACRTAFCTESVDESRAAPATSSSPLAITVKACLNRSHMSPHLKTLPRKQPAPPYAVATWRWLVMAIADPVLQSRFVINKAFPLVRGARIS